jgi:hypothetical protein
MTRVLEILLAICAWWHERTVKQVVEWWTETVLVRGAGRGGAAGAGWPTAGCISNSKRAMGVDARAGPV